MSERVETRKNPVTGEPEARLVLDGRVGQWQKDESVREMRTTDDNVRELKWIPGEKDPHGIDPKTGGAKMDYGKAPVRSLFMDYFPRAICAVANVSEYGARKYHAKGWEKVPNGPVRYGDAGARHAIKESIEGLYDDQDSGLSHAAQEAWNALARLELMLKQGIVEDRIGNQLDPNNKPILGTARKA